MTAAAADQKVSAQAGTLTLGANAAGAIGVDGDNLYIENSVDTKAIVFRVDGGGSNNMLDLLKIDGMGLEILDDKYICFGSDEDVHLQYNATAGSIELEANVEGAALAFDWNADQADDAIDMWRWNVADGGVMTLANKASESSYAHKFLTFTPNATLVNSVAAFGGDVTIAGDLTVSGDTVQVDVATLSVEDPLIEMARGQGNSADALDIGFYGKYGVGGTHKYAGLFRDANDSGKFHLFKDLQAAPTTTVNRSGTGYAKGTLVVDSLEANSVQANIAVQAMSKTGNYTWNVDDGSMILANASGGAFTITLPAGNASGYAGLSLKVKKVDTSGNAVTVTQGASGTIDGGTHIVMESAHAAVEIFCDGTNWHVL